MGILPGQQYFGRRPDDGVSPRQWKIRRCGATEKLIGTCLSHDLIGGYTHWFRGRTLPCVDPSTCEACQASTPRRWHSWFAAKLTKFSELVIIEITERAVEPFDSWFRQHRTLRGVCFELSRKGRKENGQLCVRLKDGVVPSDQLQSIGEIDFMLLRMWEMPDNVPMREKKAKRDGDEPGTAVAP